MILTGGRSEKHWWLYVLRLEGDKWYVGITSKTPEERFAEHKNKVRSAYWTIQYRPIEIVDRRDLGLVTREQAEDVESKTVRKYIREYGTNSTRGGDLRDTRDYIILGRTVYDKEGFKDTVIIACMLVVLALFVVDKYIARFIPGGV